GWRSRGCRRSTGRGTTCRMRGQARNANASPRAKYGSFGLPGSSEKKERAIRPQDDVLCVCASSTYGAPSDDGECPAAVGTPPRPGSEGEVWILRPVGIIREESTCRSASG